MKVPWHKWRFGAARVIGMLVLMVAALVSYTATSLWRMPGPTEVNAMDILETSGEALHVASGRHLVAYVISASDCGWCTLSETRTALSQIPDSLRATHATAFDTVTIIGVALDRNVEAGYAYLAGLSPDGPGLFDQIGVGGSWVNELFGDLLWRREVTEASVPQVVIVERAVEVTKDPIHGGLSVRRPKADSVIMKAVGKDEIVQWLARGLPLAH